MSTYDFSTSNPRNSIETKEGQRSLLTRSFLYMFLLMLVTTVVSFGLVFIFNRNGIDRRTYEGLLIGASITQIILTVVIAFSALRSGKGVLVWFILYAVCMGVLISSFGFVLDPITLAAAFGIAACSFGGMALFGLFSKNASGMGMVGFGLLFGVMMVSLFNVILFFVVRRSTWNTMNMIVSIITVVAICLITAFDVYNIKRVAEAGVDAPNLALYFAFNLYTDFIMILIHILRIIVIMQNNNNR